MDEFRLKSEIKNGHKEVVFGSFFNVKITHLPLDHHSDYIISFIVSILSEQVAQYATCHMDEVWLNSEIQNGRH